MTVSTFLVLGAIAVMVLAGITIYRQQSGRTPHLQALVAGEVTIESLPDALQRRLASPSHRTALAGTLRKTAKDASKVARKRMLPNPPVTYFFTEHVREQIVRVADLVEQPDTPPQAIALTELMLSDGSSPFYGENEAALVDALHQIRTAGQSTAA